MNIILLSSVCKKRGSIDICVQRVAAWLLPSVAMVAGLLVWAGYELGVHRTEASRSQTLTAELRGILADERASIDEARSKQRADLDALALRIGGLQARVMRMDALGERLVGIGKLDKDEFDFTAVPAVGGLDATDGVSQTAVDIDVDMQRLDALLADRESKLDMLEAQLNNRALITETLPSGRPIKKGWISSFFGYRTDPYSGKKTLHHGIDFAGKSGTQVHAVAAGVVERSGKASGYGNLVEIRHADGYTTLYGHNKRNLVKKGDVIAKGQVIALLGSTGRSTGPHVHFEVHKDGKVVNPRRYIRAP